VEGLSLALLDAMGAGVCPLVSDIPENCEAIADAGFTFRHGDGDDLERMLRLLIHDRRMRQLAGLRARERASENYLWTKVAAQIEAVYYAAVAERRSARQGLAAREGSAEGIRAA